MKADIPSIQFLGAARAPIGRAAMDFFAEALQSDVSDIQQRTTAEGVHLGAMAGTVDLVQRVSTGLEVRGDVLHLAPELPQEMERLDMRIRNRGHSLDLRLTRVFRLNDDATDRGTHGDVPGDAP